MKPESKPGLQPMFSSDISIGALLSETIFKDKMNGSMLKSENETGLLTTKSFTGRFWGLLSGHEQQSLFADSASSRFSHPQHKSSLLNSSSSILDGEVTCHAFAFRKLTSGGDVDSVNRRDLYKTVHEDVCIENFIYIKSVVAKDPLEKKEYTCASAVAANLSS